VGSGGGSSKMKILGATRTVGHAGRCRVPVQNLTFVGYHRFIHQLIDKYSGLRSSMPNIFLDFNTEEYSSVVDSIGA
jgi:hypothetical protein